MRVVGQIPHPYVKITVFSYQLKYTVKMEMGQVEQTYKIRNSDKVKDVSDLSALIDDELINECIDHFTLMFNSMNAAFKRLGEKKDAEEKLAAQAQSE
ncbi:MAG: hypothetical protein M9887_09530 [Chitinophagales bacterium]|nr:hypothetical protein [Chitinophagales bacterium]